MTKALFVFALFFLLLVVYPNNTFAIHEPEKVKWKLVYLTGNHGCSNYDHYITKVYDEIAERYMEWYQFDNDRVEPTCISEKTYSPDNLPSDLDLLILVYERGIGRADLNSNGVGGIYLHSGNDKSTNHVIIICDCPNFQYSDPVWILSHELSHFILYHRGYGPDVVEDLIHNIDTRYDYCVDHKKFELCKDIKGELWISTQAYKRSVISPYIPNEDETKSDNFPSLNFMQKEITNFWIEGKITDEEYLRAMGYDVEHFQEKPKQTDEPYFDTQKRLFADTAKDKKINVILHDGDFSLSQQQLETILENVPLNLLENTNSTSVINIKIPQEFKPLANLWLDRKLTNNEYFIVIDNFFEGLIKNYTSPNVN